MANHDFDWKKFQFIATVQTALISNAINRSLDDDAIANRHRFSPPTVIFDMAEAFRAAERIPENIDAVDAADQFLPVMFQWEGAEIQDWFRPTREDK
jgi:hypothetical protein